MSAYKLILLPADPHCPAVSTDRLAMELQAIGLIDRPHPLNGDRFYPAGENFLQLVSFLGCSPRIELEPPSDPETLAADSASGKFCHVFLDSSEILRFRSDPCAPVARCPTCRSPLANWQSRLQPWQDNRADSNWHCAQCGSSGDISALNLGKTAGFGHSFVEIRGIFPSEAVPSETLLNTLKSLTHEVWSTLYIKE